MSLGGGAASTAKVAVQAPALGRGAQVGRYIVIDLVGRGGMGEVYAAYDPELGRRIALKLVRADRNDVKARTRILREAQATARLSHPNVVGVHDVGTHGDGVFIAMEFVEGRTVRAWVDAERPDWREILRAFVAAGRGLQAAHEAGIVHRDFKADNALMGRDGKVRVADFGLARRIDAGDEAPAVPAPAAPPSPANGAEADTVPLRRSRATPAGAEAAPALESTSVHFLNVDVTRAGVVMGTPVYMAPEHIAGLSLDARSDQFSYCVALHAALFGERPFSDELRARHDEILAGRIREPPPSSRVPGWVRRVIARGLRARPGERWPDMAALLAALEHDPSAAQRRRLRTLLATGAALALAAAALGVGRRAAPPRPLCGDGRARAAEAWPVDPTDPRRAAVRAAFLATGREYAADVFNQTSRLVDGYVAGWQRMYREACEATHARGEQSTEVLDLRMGCLDERLAAVNAVGRALSRADASTVENAVAAASALPPLARCADVALLRAVVRPPDDPQVRARVEALRRDVGESAALVRFGQCQQVRARLAAELPAVRATGYSPLVAEALNVAGQLGDVCGDRRQATLDLKEALWEAEAGRDDERVAQVATLLAFAHGNWRHDPDGGDDWANLAGAALRRIGDHELLQAWLLVTRGVIAEERGDFAASLAFQQRALEIKQRLLGPDHLDTLGSANNTAVTLTALGRYDEAEPICRHVVTATEATLGRMHPTLGRALGNHAEILNGLGRPAEGAAAAARALDVYRRNDADSYFLAFALTAQAESALALGRAGQARAALEEALAIREAKDPSPANLGETRFALARALWEARGERARALPLAEAARADYARAAGRARQLGAVDAWLTAHRAR